MAKEEKRKEESQVEEVVESISEEEAQFQRNPVAN